MFWNKGKKQKAYRSVLTVFLYNNYSVEVSAAIHDKEDRQVPWGVFHIQTQEKQHLKTSDQAQSKNVDNTKATKTISYPPMGIRRC